jgi:predicted hydrocarbon binding protein
MAAGSGQRGLAFFVMPGNALKSLSDELYIDIGDEKTRDALYRFGYRCGENMTRDLDLHCDELDDMAETLPALIMQTGLGTSHVRIAGSELHVVFEDSLEALMCGKKGTCNFTRGYLAGLSSSLLKGEYICSEVECLSQKHKRCVFRIRKGTGEVVPRIETAARVIELENVSSVKLEDGGGYLIEEEIPRKSYDIFVSYLAKGYDGLCVTREYPEKIRKQFMLKTTPILWLTRTGKEGCIGPERLSELYHKIGNFLNASKRGIVLLSGLEYLISQNSFASVLKFVQLLRDQIAIHNAILLAPISPLTVEERELKLIEREFEIIRI